MKSRPPIVVGFGIPTGDGWIRSELSLAFFEAYVSNLLAEHSLWSLGFIGHRSHLAIAAARMELCECLKSCGGSCDVLVMVDSDQACAGEDWMDAIVKAVRTEPLSTVWFGVTPLGYQDPEAKADGWVRDAKGVEFAQLHAR